MFDSLDNTQCETLVIKATTHEENTKFVDIVKRFPVVLQLLKSDFDPAENGPFKL